MSVTSDRLRVLREEVNLTQEELSKKIGIKRTRYAKYETGENPLSGDIINKLADFYGVTTDYLYGRSPLTLRVFNEKGINNEYTELIDEFERKGLSPERVKDLLDELSLILEKYKSK